MAACRERHLQPSVQHFPFGGSACLRNLHKLGEKLQFVEAVFCQVEHAACLCRGHVDVYRIEAVLLHVHGVVHPLAVLQGRRRAARGVVVGYARDAVVVFVDADGAWHHRSVLAVGLVLGGGTRHVEASVALVGGAVGGCDYGLRDVPVRLGGDVFDDVGLLGHGLHQLVVHIEVHLLDGLGGQTGMNLDGQHVVLGHLHGCRTDVDGGLFLVTWHGSHGVLGCITGHILLDPRHGRTLGAVPVKTRVIHPRGSENIAPQGHSGAVGGFPHQGQNLLELRLLLAVVGLVDIQLGDVHGHLQRVLLLLQHVRQFVGADVAHVVRLVAVGVDGRACIAQRLHQGDVVVHVPPQRVVVVVDQYGIGPALVGHVEGFDEPVVARLAASAQRLLHHGVALLVHAHGLVHHVNHGQRLVLGLRVVEPVGEGGEALPCRQALQPARILGAPHQGVELVGEVVLLGVVEGPVAAPVKAASGALDGRPFRLVLAGDLVPERVVRRHASACFHISSGGDVAKELVGVRRQLCLCPCEGQQGREDYR